MAWIPTTQISGIWLVLIREFGQRTTTYFLLMDEVATCAIWAVTEVVEGSAGLRLIFRVPVYSSQLCLSMGKLALTAIFAAAGLLEATAKLSLVTVRGQHWWNLRLEGR